MNIFELVLSDPSSYQQTSQELVAQQNNWQLFQSTLFTLLSVSPAEAEPLLQRNRNQWANVRRFTPELIPVMSDYYLQQLEDLLLGKLQPRLQLLISTFANPAQLEQQVASLMQAVREVYHIHYQYLQTVDNESRLAPLLQLHTGNLLVACNFKEKISQLLRLSFHRSCLNVLKSQVLEFEEPVRQYIQERSSKETKGDVPLQVLRGVLDGLQEIGLLQEYFEPTSAFLCRQTQQFITACTDFAENGQFLKHCLAYERSFQKQWIKNLKTAGTQSHFNTIANRLDDEVHFLCAKNCSGRILDIILDFPDSLPTILALKKCLQKTSLLGQLGQHLSGQVSRRLLIPGVITQSILNQYINMLKVLQLLDPQGIIFEQVTLPIKNYLLRRNDTLRCIISHLTDDVENYSKLTRQVVKIPSKEYIEEMSSEQDENAAREWQILPARQNKAKVRVKYQEIDLVTVLVGLYGSQQAFISEYQNMMAEKLMSAKDYNIDEEIRNIELLKMRFGQSALQTCNIIVKDVKDSRRNDSVIHKKLPSPAGALGLTQLNCLAVSKGYWPINYENASSFQLPNDFKAVFEQYAVIFAQIKAMRKIFFHYNLGHVNLTLTFDNGSFPFKCLPVQAVMITFFDEDRIKDPKLGVSSEQISHELQLAPNVVKQKMSFWVHKGVVKQNRQQRNNLSLRRLNSFEDGEVVYYRPVSVYENTVKEDMDDDVESSLLKESTSMESHLRHIIEGLILSILNTNGPKPPEKIHLLLKTVYKTDLDYSYGQAQTAEILKKMLQKKKIQFNGEAYSSRQE